MCLLYLLLFWFWLTTTEPHIFKIKFYLLQFVLINLDVDWSSVGCAFIRSASAFVVLHQSNFLVLMTT